MRRKLLSTELCKASALQKSRLAAAFSEALALARGLGLRNYQVAKKVYVSMTTCRFVTYIQSYHSFRTVEKGLFH